MLQTHARKLRQVRKKPGEWARQFGLMIVDTAGWNRPEGKGLETPLTRNEFIQKSHCSTSRVVDRARYERFRRIAERLAAEVTRRFLEQFGPLE